MFGKITLAVATIALMATPSMGTLLLNETFSYSDGGLVANSGGNWTAHSGAGSNSQTVSSGMASLVQGSGSREDTNRLIGSTLAAGGKWYAGFDVSVDGSTATGPVYFAHFKDSTTTNFSSRVWSAAPQSAGDYTLALSSSSNAPINWGADLDFGTTYRVVISYAFDTGAAELWVNPANELSTKITDTGTASRALLAFALRQGTPPSGANATTQLVDNLLVGTTFNEVVPEPGTLSLLGIGALALIRRRR